VRLILLTYDLYLPGSRCLKDKRKAVKGLIERLRARFNVSAAEVDHIDLIRRATIAVARVVSSGEVDRVNSFIDRTINACSEVQVLRYEKTEF